MGIQKNQNRVYVHSGDDGEMKRTERISGSKFRRNRGKKTSKGTSHEQQNFILTESNILNSRVRFLGTIQRRLAPHRTVHRCRFRDGVSRPIRVLRLNRGNSQKYDEQSDVLVGGVGGRLAGPKAPRTP